MLLLLFIQNNSKDQTTEVTSSVRPLPATEGKYT